jgi:hypothetical protein
VVPEVRRLLGTMRWGEGDGLLFICGHHISSIFFLLRRCTILYQGTSLVPTDWREHCEWSESTYIWTEGVWSVCDLSIFRCLVHKASGFTLIHVDLEPFPGREKTKMKTLSRLLYEELHIGR